MWQKTKPELIFFVNACNQLYYLEVYYLTVASVVLQSRKFTSIWPQFHTELFYNQVDSQSKLVFFRVAGTEGWSNPISIFFVEMNETQEVNRFLLEHRIQHRPLKIVNLFSVIWVTRICNRATIRKKYIDLYLYSYYP